jgi:MFS transporter, FSR family, fosmidomycin resistance protein
LALPAMIVLGQELVPGRVGLIAGLFFGATLGIAGIAAAGFGLLADVFGLAFVFQLCAVLPVLGLLTVYLPKAPAHEYRIRHIFQKLRRIMQMAI